MPVVVIVSTTLQAFLLLMLPCSVVASKKHGVLLLVVRSISQGPYRSGKSFLLNQLLGVGCSELVQSHALAQASV
jgi:hypothetical protein